MAYVKNPFFLQVKHENAEALCKYGHPGCSYSSDVTCQAAKTVCFLSDGSDRVGQVGQVGQGRTGSDRSDRVGQVGQVGQGRTGSDRSDRVGQVGQGRTGSDRSDGVGQVGQVGQVGRICPATGHDGLGTGTRGARTQAMSPAKRLNMTKPQSGQSPRFALLRKTTV